MSTLQKIHATKIHDMKALIIYDGFAAGAKANAALKHSTENLAFDVQWNVRPWRLDMLKFTPTLKQAMAEALDAHLIVLASQTAQPLPAWLLTWLEHWAKCRHVAEAAIAVFGIGQAMPFSSSTASHLAEFAQRCGLGLFFVESGEPWDAGTIGVGSIQEKTLGMLPMPLRAWEEGICDSFNR
jgi:hypothetical protein